MGAPKAIALVAFLAIVHSARSHWGAGGPSAAPKRTPCAERLLNLTACLTYVEEGSNLTRPRKGCCSSLANLVYDEPICLCRLIADDGDGVGVRVDTTRALMLPAACHVDAPPTSLCAVPSTPMSSPSPTSEGPEMPEAPPAGSSPSSAIGIPSATPANNSSGHTALGTFNLVFLLLCPLLLLHWTFLHTVSQYIHAL